MIVLISYISIVAIQTKYSTMGYKLFMICSRFQWLTSQQDKESWLAEASCVYNTSTTDVANYYFGPNRTIDGKFSPSLMFHSCGTFMNPWLQVFHNVQLFVGRWRIFIV